MAANPSERRQRKDFVRRPGGIMNRMPVFGVMAVVAAGALAAVPAVLGLAGNRSFSHEVPVRAPEHARVLLLHDLPGPSADTSPRTPTSTTTAIAQTPGASAHDRGDDHGARPDGR